MDVDVVDDEFAVGLGIERGTDDTRAALMEARHGIEEMCNMRCTVGFDGLACRVVVSCRMAEGDDDVVFRQSAMKRPSSWSFSGATVMMRTMSLYGAILAKLALAIFFRPALPFWRG